MTDRVYPSAKTNGTTTNGGAAVTATTKPTTAAKPNLYNPTRPHPYRPQPNHSRRRHRSQRSCVCLCCFWSFLFVAVLILLARHRRMRRLRPLLPPPPRILRRRPQNLPIQPLHQTPPMIPPASQPPQPHNLRQKSQQKDNLHLRPHLHHRLDKSSPDRKWVVPVFHQCPPKHNNYSIFAFNCFGTRRCRFGEGPEIGSEEEKWVGSENFDGHKSGGEDGEIEE
ncbi:hypothetical protein Acr_25g0006290 [Actinidia rufa]|uniref:Transmembrane protein n=1 Tax=Actinidia rufa TaxID=165716 RepID=A0A7J0GZF3_9ERIC|nr:hypothetical protein Acr_25g0006290 [Actinidia rufa]